MDCDSEDLNELINVSITPKYLTEDTDKEIVLPIPKD